MTAFFIDGESVRTSDKWRALRGYARAGASFRTILKNYARRHGLAVAMLASDAALQYELIDGRLRCRTFPAGTVTWDWEGK